MAFSKEILLSRISELNDFQTIQRIAQDSFFVSLITTWFITIIIYTLIVSLSDGENRTLAFIVSIIVNLCLTVLTVLGFLPALLTFQIN